jgi:hypothetical protein
MSPNDIQAGKTYTNRGAGKTRRTVIAIGDEHRPKRWNGLSTTKPNEPGVLYEQGGKRRNLYLPSFAQWVGREVA